MSDKKGIFALLEKYGLDNLADKATPDGVLQKLAGKLIGGRVSGTPEVTTKHWGSKNKNRQSSKVRRKMAAASRRANRPARKRGKGGRK